jgi:hypothetical protein
VSERAETNSKSKICSVRKNHEGSDSKSNLLLVSTNVSHNMPVISFSTN